jgi:CelD/BcsL family acetyltransferase involved in cellulose biosynthesis
MAQAPSGRGSIRALPRSVSPYLPLTSTWEDYLGSRSQRFRKQLKRARRKLSEMGQAAVTRLLPADDCAQWMAEVIAINERSWKARRGTDLLRHPALKGFFLDLVAELAPQGHIDLHVLRLDGRAVAYELGFDFGSRIFAYNAGYLQELAPLSPGNVVTAAVIESACARGRVEYDMLRGDEDYKLRFGDRLRSESELLVPAERWPARAYALVGPYLKARLRGSRWLKELDDRLTGLRSRLRHRGRGSPRQACGPRS